MTERLFVVAGTWAEFNHWCHDRQLSPRDRAVAYVRDWTTLMGQPQGLRYVVVGTGRSRRDYRLIRDVLADRGAVYDERDGAMGDG